MPRRIQTMAAVFGGAAALCAACSPTTRHRVLSFFFDGVPQPASAPATSGAVTPESAAAVEPASGPTPVQRFFAHTPYRDNRCGGCHDFESGQLVRSVQDGLCLNCHSPIKASLRYVHGPVAVDDCTSCHHYHYASFPNLLLRNPTDTCLECHDRGDLGPGDHHATIGPQGCVACHHPHGGEDRFFLKRSTP
mgnify:FL=1